MIDRHPPDPNERAAFLKWIDDEKSRQTISLGVVISMLRWIIENLPETNAERDARHHAERATRFIRPKET